MNKPVKVEPKPKADIGRRFGTSSTTHTHDCSTPPYKESKPCDDTAASIDDKEVSTFDLIGRLLMLLRDSRGYTQQMLADVLSKNFGLGLRQGWISRLEHGGVTDWGRFAAICAALHCRPSRITAVAERLVDHPPRWMATATNAIAIDHGLRRYVRLLAEEFTKESIPGQQTEADRKWHAFSLRIGDAVRIVRLRRRLTQRAVLNRLLNQKISLSAAYLSSVESGRKRVSWMQLGLLCQAMDCYLSDVFIEAEQLTLAQENVGEAMETLLNNVKEKLQASHSDQEEAYLLAIEAETRRRLDKIRTTRSPT
jgi:transcriptional regulator with XRE-family HTH domain